MQLAELEIMATLVLWVKDHKKSAKLRMAGVGQSKAMAGPMAGDWQDLHRRCRHRLAHQWCPGWRRYQGGGHDPHGPYLLLRSRGKGLTSRAGGRVDKSQAHYSAAMGLVV